MFFIITKCYLKGYNTRFKTTGLETLMSLESLVLTEKVQDVWKVQDIWDLRRISVSSPRPKQRFNVVWALGVDGDGYLVFLLVLFSFNSIIIVI